MLLKQYQFLLLFSCIYFLKCEKIPGKTRVPSEKHREISAIFDGRPIKNGTSQISSNQTSSKVENHQNGTKVVDTVFKNPENDKNRPENITLATESPRTSSENTREPSDILDQIFPKTEGQIAGSSRKESDRRRFKLRVIKRNITNGAIDSRRKPEGFKKHDKLALESQHVYVTVSPDGYGRPKNDKKSSKNNAEFQTVIKSINFFVPPEEEEFSIQKSKKVTLEHPVILEGKVNKAKKYQSKETKIKSQIERFDSQKRKVDEKKVPVPEIGSDWSPKYSQNFEELRRQGTNLDDKPDPKAELKKVYEKIFLEKIGEITETLANQDVPTLFNDGPVIFGLFQAAIKPQGLKFDKSKPVKRSKFYSIDNSNERKLSIDPQIISNQINQDPKSSESSKDSSSKVKSTQKNYSTYVDPSKNTWQGMPSSKLNTGAMPQVLGDDPNSWVGYSSPQYSYKYTIFNGENMFRRKFNGAPGLEKPQQNTERPYTVFDGAKVFQRQKNWNLVPKISSVSPSFTNPHLSDQNQVSSSGTSTFMDLSGQSANQEFMDHIGSPSIILGSPKIFPGGPQFMKGEEVIWNGPTTARLNYENPLKSNFLEKIPGPNFDIKPAFRKFGDQELGVGFVRLGFRDSKRFGNPKRIPESSQILVNKRELGSDENYVVNSKIEISDLPRMRSLENFTENGPKVVEQNLEIPNGVFVSGNVGSHPGNFGSLNMGLFLGPNPYISDERSEVRMFQPFPTLQVPGIIGLRPPRPGFNFLRRNGKVKRVIPSYLPTAPYLPEKSYLLEPPRAFQKNLDLFLDPNNGVNQEVGIKKNNVKNSTEFFGLADPFWSSTPETSSKIIQRVTPIFGASAPKPVHLEPVLELLKSDRSKTKPVTEIDSEITKLGASKYHFDDSGYINDVPNFEDIPYGPPRPPKVVTNLEPKKINKNLNKIFGIESVPFGARNASGFKLRKFPEENKALRLRNHRFSGTSTRLQPSYGYNGDIPDQILRSELIRQINFLDGRRQGSSFPLGLQDISGFHTNRGGFGGHPQDSFNSNRRVVRFPVGLQDASGFRTNSRDFEGHPQDSINDRRGTDFPLGFQDASGFHTRGFRGHTQLNFNYNQNFGANHPFNEIHGTSSTPKVTSINFNGELNGEPSRVDTKVPDSKIITLNSILSKIKFQNGNFQPRRQFLSPSVAYPTQNGGSTDQETKDIFLKSENRNYNFLKSGPTESPPLYTEAIFKKFEETDKNKKPNVVQTSDKLDIYYFQ